MLMQLSLMLTSSGDIDKLMLPAAPLCAPPLCAAALHGAHRGFAVLQQQP
jgi:hypothetical protein